MLTATDEADLRARYLTEHPTAEEVMVIPFPGGEAFIAGFRAIPDQTLAADVTFAPPRAR